MWNSRIFGTEAKCYNTMWQFNRFCCGANLISGRPAKQKAQHISDCTIRSPESHFIDCYNRQVLSSSRCTETSWSICISDFLRYDIFSYSNCTCKLYHYNYLQLMFMNAKTTWWGTQKIVHCQQDHICFVKTKWQSDHKIFIWSKYWLEERRLNAIKFFSFKCTLSCLQKNKKIDIYTVTLHLSYTVRREDIRRHLDGMTD